MDCIGIRLRASRKRKGLNVEAVAAHIKKDRSMIFRYERNDIKNLSVQTLHKLAVFYGVSISYLVGESEQEDI